jgi:nicotinamidase-related amidase
MQNTALVVVDMQYDFIDGSLACQNADNAISQTLKFIDKHTKGQRGEEHEILDTFPILFTRDYHPADHSSFAEQGGTWPTHCVAGTHGAEIHESLVPYVCEELTFDKGCDKSSEQYSGFEGQNNAEQSLGEILEMLDTTDVYVCGIATEYCVRNTCEDLKKAGYKVHLLSDCLGYVDENGHRQALQEMSDNGICVE